MDLKRFIDFKTCYLLLSPWTPLPTRLVLLEIFAYPSNKSIIYGPELNYKKPYIVSAIRRRRDIKIPLCLSAHVRKKFNIVSNDHGQAHKCNFSVFDWEYIFSANLVKKNQNSLRKKKCRSYMQNLMVMFTFSVFDWKYPFCINLVQKIQIVSLSWNLVPRLTQICRI